MKIGLTQLCVGADPQENLETTLPLVENAFAAGAQLVCTPEVTGFITTDANRQAAIVTSEAADVTLAALRDCALQNKRWISIGSLAVTAPEGDGRLANRSFLIAPDGQIAARYDKIHMFDVTVSETETYRESRRYAPGQRAVTAQTPLAHIGLSICYDLRFPHLYRALAKAGAEVLLVPSAFSPVTGRAHWETLLRARAIETGCFVVAAAQSGQHVQHPKPRATHGHSMVVNPWGEVILDMGTAVGVTTVDLDLAEVAQARQRIAALDHDRPFEGP